VKYQEIAFIGHRLEEDEQPLDAHALHLFIAAAAVLFADVITEVPYVADPVRQYRHDKT